MSSIPSGSVTLCRGIPFANDYNHTIDFDSAEQQRRYFLSKAKYTIDRFTYIRKNSIIQVGKSLDELADVNYVMYRSSNNSKYYYCFIVNKQYVNNNVTDLYIEIDVMQTYMFDYTVNNSYVEREHADRWTTDYKPVWNYTHENLNCGDVYLTEKAYKVDNGSDIMWFVVLMSAAEGIHGDDITLPAAINDIPSPFFYYLIPHKKGDATFQFMCEGNPASNISDFMRLMGDSAVGSAVREISYTPYLPFTMEVNETGDITPGEGVAIHFETLSAKDNWLGSINELITGDDDFVFHAMRIDAKSSTFDITRNLCSWKWDTGLKTPAAADWETIRNNPLQPINANFESRLFMAPYRFNLLTNWRGGTMVVQNEYCPENIHLRFTKVFGFNNPARFWISEYKGDYNGRGDNITDDHSLQLPIISDAYYNYLLENRNQLNANVITQLGNIATGAAFGGAMGAVGGAVSAAAQIVQQIGHEKDLKAVPDGIINANDCALAIGDENTYMTFYRYVINPEQLERLSQFFHMYGYHVAKMKTPNLKSRNRFNYIKTISANITGDFDYDDLIKIRSVFNNGITFWHYSDDNFYPLNYDYINVEVNLLNG